MASFSEYQKLYEECLERQERQIGKLQEDVAALKTQMAVLRVKVAAAGFVVASVVSGAVSWFMKG